MSAELFIFVVHACSTAVSFVLNLIECHEVHFTCMNIILSVVCGKLCGNYVFMSKPLCHI